VLIGGCVRDKFMGVESKDIDVEVHGCTIEQLEKVLSKLGKVDAVGKSFGIIKFKKDGVDFDFSVPRKENRIGTGHKDFEVILEPMTKEEAAFRRDFTFNSMAFDPLTNTLFDFFDGLEDLKNGIIRHTSDKFKEDSLRILRGLGFQSRFGFIVDRSTFETMKEMSEDLIHLPKERLSEEFMKWAIKGKHPEMIFDFLRESGAMILISELGLLKDTEQDPHWHPEGSVETHTKWVLKRMFDICERENITGDDRAVFIFAALLHDIAKPQTTEKTWSEKHQRICVTSNRHDVVGSKMTEEILTRIGIKPVIIEKVVKLVKFHLAHTSLFSIENLRSRKSALLKLSKNIQPASISDVLFLIEADALGRGDVPEEKIIKVRKEIEDVKRLAETLHVTIEQRKSILMGRHLIEIGLKPGLIFGEILKEADEAQDNIEFTTLKGAKLWLNHRMNPNIKTKILVLFGKMFGW
jgi:tRNA nucleotidyltransferase (CCA-adding enzyme)